MIPDEAVEAGVDSWPVGSVTFAGHTWVRRENGLIEYVELESKEDEE